MNLQRIQTVLVYSWHHLKHSLETWMDLVWFPIIEVLVFGFLGSSMMQLEGDYLEGLLIGLLFWEVFRLSQYSVTVGMMWDVWSDSFSPLFTTPLSLKEYLVGHCLSGVLKSLAVFLLTAAISLIIFGFNIFTLGPSLVLYLFGLLIFGWALGIFASGLILRFGKNIASLSWSLVFIFQPISAIFYPVEAFPAQIRWLSYISPITYIMQAVRFQLKHGHIYWSYLGLSFLLILIYLLLAYLYTHLSHLKSRDKGLFANLDY